MKTQTDEQKINNNNIVEKYHTLQTDYYHIEDEKSALENRLKKLKKRYRLTMILLAAAGIIGSGYFWFEEISVFLPSSWKTEETQQKVTDNNIVTVQQQKLQNKLSLTGKIEPLSQMEVLAPLEGTVKEKNFQYGEFAEKDKLLLVIDAGGEQVEYREAQAAYLEAEAEVETLKNWKNSTEVAGKRRDLTKARYALKTTLRKLEESRRLLEKGIVAASEVKGLKEEYRNEQLDHQHMQEQLADTLKQGDKKKLQAAELKQKNTLFKMLELEARIRNARVVNPMDGVVLLPTSRQEDVSSSEIQHGSFVKQDQGLFTIANLQGYNIKAKVDEIDILKLKIGQKVTVTGDAFAKNFILQGTVNYISSQADKESAQRQDMPSSFTVSILVSELGKEQKKQMLLGMSTDMEVLISEKQNALVVPFDAVTVDEKEQAWVTKLAEETGESEKIQVEIGITAANTVEIVKGLEVGDKIFKEPPPPKK